MQARTVRFALAAALLLPVGATAADPATAQAEKSPRVTPVVEAYRKAAPAVVNISTERLINVGWSLFGGEDDPFEELLPRRTMRAISLGSGVVIHPDGYVVTNAHVVRQAEKIKVTLADKSAFQAEVVAANDAHDLAVLRIRDAGKRQFSCLPLGRSDDLMIGETVIAIGNPLGYQNTCTTGVISALDRTLEFRGGVAYGGLIQIDAPINPGNSGGPLLNVAGEFIGINTAIRPDAQGIGFAVPADVLVADMPRLLDFERLARIVVGLIVRQVRADGADAVVVASVGADTPAAQAGCKPGDRVLAVNGRPVQQLPDYQVPMLAMAPGSEVLLRLLREGREVEVRLTVRARPKPDGAALAWRLLGMRLAPITPDLARQMRLEVDVGLAVTELDPKGPAARLGLRRGDVIFHIGRWYVTNLEGIGAILEDAQPGDALRVGILRGNVRAWGSLEVPKVDISPPPGPERVRT